MAASSQVVGSVVSLWRYPVKSMLGEELNASEVTLRGLLGDRAYALVDRTTGMVASAKNPRAWPRMFDFRAALAETPRLGAPLPPVRITLPDGTVLSSTQADLNQLISQAIERPVTLEAADGSRADGSQPQGVSAGAPSGPGRSAEAYWPDIEGLIGRDAVTDFEFPEGTFFDGAVVHLLTTATLGRLQELYPQGRFEVRRFRPNIVVATASGATEFTENDWVGHTLALGADVRLRIDSPCKRCVMTTLPQGDLPRDMGILRTAAERNRASVGVNVTVERGGLVRRGDAVSLQ